MRASIDGWNGRMRSLGEWLKRRQRSIRHLQWGIVAVYLLLVAVPAFLPLPGRAAHLWNNLTLIAQFAFWGVWWPFVLLSMVLFGRAWCGFFCPEGALTELVSARGKGRAVPRWVTWGGWPFVAFASTTIYGQMVSVYQYPKPVLVILGGSTVAAVAVGYLYGRNKRVWCRYLCPVNGVFGLLAKLAPLHFRIDPQAWQASQRRHDHIESINCAPLVPIRTMKGSARCHMCGRCSDFRGAVSLELRSPNAEIVTVAGAQNDPWQTVLLLFGLMGVAFGAFDWPTSPWYVAVKQAIAAWLVDHGLLWPIEYSAPWWLLTNYPARSDVLTVLDGAVLLGHILLAATLMGVVVGLTLALAMRACGRWSWRRFHHLAQTLIPLAGCGVFLGLSALTVSLLRTEGIQLPWIGIARLAFLAGASVWTLWLAWRVAGIYAAGARRLLAVALVGAGAAIAAAGWGGLFWG